MVRGGVDVRSIRIDGDDVVVTSSYDGIHLFRIAEDGKPVPDGVMWVDSASPSEVSNSLLCVERDRDGNYWFGTVDGIYVGCERPREIFHNMVRRRCRRIDPQRRVGCLPGPDGAVWAATSGGLDRIRRVTPGRYAVDISCPVSLRRVPNRATGGFNRWLSTAGERCGSARSGCCCSSTRRAAVSSNAER